MLDFAVVLTGWLDATLEIGNFSAFRALRVLRPLRLVRFFRGIQAIVGSIYHNTSLICNVLSFMAFFLLVFGILGIQNFGGVYENRCIVIAPVPGGQFVASYNGSQATVTSYDGSYADMGGTAVWGEFENFCSNSSLAPLGNCPAYQQCWKGQPNPHRNIASFDDFIGAFFIMFQVQTLSTWYEYDYFNMQSIATIATLYNQGIVFFVGFIVSQLFVAVVCFGFENLSDQLSEPVFDAAVLGVPQLAGNGTSEDNLCGYCAEAYDPLEGTDMGEPVDRGNRDGIRVKMVYLHHMSAPSPLSVTGEYTSPFELNPLSSAHENNREGNPPTLKKDKFGVVYQGDEDLATLKPQSHDDFDEYSHYRQVMASMQQSKEQERIRLENKTSLPAECEPDIQEIEFKYSDLKAWSNETLGSTDIMLRAQEEIEDHVQINYFRDNDGVIGQRLELTIVLKDLVGPEDEETIPELKLHMRAEVRVEASLMSNDAYLACLNLSGSEPISEVKELLVQQFREQGQLADVSASDVTLLLADEFVDEDASLWKMALVFVEEFKGDPVRSIISFNVLIDQKEVFVKTAEFDTTIIVCILLNTVFLMFEHYNKKYTSKPFMSDPWELTLIISGWIFNIIFIVEMLIKFYCMKGFCNYWREAANRFDFVIVMSSIVNIFLDAFDVDMPVLKVLRVFRALRVVRVLRRVDSVRAIVDSALCSMTSIINIFVFMMVVLIVFGCLGNQLFGNMFDAYGDGILCSGKPRANFDNFYTSFFTLFQVLTGSSWELVLYDCIRACNIADAIGASFVILFFVLSNYIILNLFVGAILANMSSCTDEENDAFTRSERVKKDAQQIRAREAQLFVNKCLLKWEQRGSKGNLCALSEVVELPCARMTFENSHIVENMTRCGGLISNKSLGILPTNPIRHMFIRLVENPAFDMVILLVIIYSTCLLALDNPTIRSSDAWAAFFSFNDIVFLSIFTVEFCCKCISHGFSHTDNIELMLSSPEKLKALCLGDLGRKSYIYEPWNYLDITVLGVGYIGMFTKPDGPLKLLRLCRAFRPLRMVNRIAGMKLVLTSLVSAAPALGNVCVLLSAVYLIFAILGVSLFKGKFYSCNQCFGDYCDSFVDQDQCFGTSDGGNGYLVPNTWNNPAIFIQPATYGSFSFDDVASGYMLLFEISSGDSWETMLWAATNVPQKAREKPECDMSWAWGIYIVIFVFAGQLFMVQLFVAVVIDAFCLTEGSGLLTGDQAMLSDVVKLTNMLTPEPKPEKPGSDGLQLTAYNMFTDARPQPMPTLEKYLVEDKVPSVHNVQSIPKLVRNIEQTLKQRETLPAGDICLEKIDSALAVMKEELSIKEADLEVFNEFSWESLEGQPVPDGWVHQCGIYFDVVVTGCIIINIFFMCTYHTNQSDGWDTVQYSQNVGFTVIFVAEFIIKHLGLGIKGFWEDYLNAFDGIVVIVSVIFIPLEGGAIAGLFRVCRIFRLIKRAPQIRALMTTLVMTIPSITNVFMVLFLVFFISAVIGVELFGKLRYGTSIGSISNFSTWLDAMHLLWRGALGNWRSTYYDTVVTNPDCSNLLKDSAPDMDDDYTDCGDPIKGCIFFIMFQVVSAFAVLNLVIAIILNAFTWCYSLEPSEITGSLNISAHHLRHFKAIWDRFDTDGYGSMPVSNLKCLLAIAQHNVPNLFKQGEVNQKDESNYTDFSSWGSGPQMSDVDEYEEKCHANYDSLIDDLKKIEQSRQVFERLEENGEDVWQGDNTNVFDEDFERWNKSNTTPLLAKKGGELELLGVEFKNLIYLLIQEPLGLQDHDKYVNNNFQDPFLTLLPGYAPESITDSLRIITGNDTIAEDVVAASPAAWGSNVVMSLQSNMVTQLDNPICAAVSDNNKEDQGDSGPIWGTNDEKLSPGGRSPAPEEKVDPYEAWLVDHCDLFQTYFDRYSPMSKCHYVFIYFHLIGTIWISQAL